MFLQSDVIHAAYSFQDPHKNIDIRRCKRFFSNKKCVFKLLNVNSKEYQSAKMAIKSLQLVIIVIALITKEVQLQPLTSGCECPRGDRHSQARFCKADYGKSRLNICTKLRVLTDSYSKKTSVLRKKT